jgi:adenosylcobalamin-dependent ribonucleoside-triphosphate reductase
VTEVPWGPTGEVVYKRTYSRTKPDGSSETWPETVERVVDGNLALRPDHLRPNEREDLIRLMTEFKILPAGRHLWMSGIKGRQYLFNCHVAGWNPEDITDHFTFTFLRLAEGGGVGTNYSNHHLMWYDSIRGFGGNGWDDPGVGYQVHIVCDPSHPDYEALREAGLISTEYTSNWAGAFQVEDTREGWAAALVDLMQTYYRPALNQRRVFDVSRVRWKGARLQTSGGHASGPLPLAEMLHSVAGVMNLRLGQKLDGLGAMEIDHAIASAVVAGGNRRSARMAIMHWKDRQIFEFIQSKQDPSKNWTTNISVEVDDEFFEAADAFEDVYVWKSDEPIYRIAANHAACVLKAIAEGMLENGEPGFWNSSLSNDGEPNRVIATNPCGEIALEPWENCNLGHVNLAAFVDKETGQVDYEDMRLAHQLITRFLMRATYGDVRDEKQAEVLARNRRIGVGHLGVASFLALTGVKYSEAPEDWGFALLLEQLATEVSLESSNYAHDLRVPVPVKTRTVAPTGTIAKMPGVSEGIHPIFGKYFIRRIRFSDNNPAEVATVEEYRRKGYGVEPCQYAANTTVVSLPTKDSLLAQVENLRGELGDANEIVQGASDLTLEDMLKFQRMYQTHWADNAVSYTVNLDPDRYTNADLEKAILHFGPDIKGATVFPEKSRPQSPYERISEADYKLYELWQQASVADGVDENCSNGACPIK